MSTPATSALPAAAFGEDDETFPPAPNPDLSDDPNVDPKIRCRRCNRLLAEYAGRPWCLRCPRCKTVRASGPAVIRPAVHNSPS